MLLEGHRAFRYRENCIQALALEYVTSVKFLEKFHTIQDLFERTFFFVHVLQLQDADDEEDPAFTPKDGQPHQSSEERDDSSDTSTSTCKFSHSPVVLQLLLPSFLMKSSKGGSTRTHSHTDTRTCADITPLQHGRMSATGLAAYRAR
jgi:hypothetical protein